MSFECLNSKFTVISYNGGAIKGPQGIEKLFQAPSNKEVVPCASRSGKSFDIVLQYNNPDAKTEEENVFTLTHLIISYLTPDEATAPLKSGVVFVNQTPDISYSTSFDNLTAEEYDKTDFPDLPTPAAFFNAEKPAATVCRALDGCTGKYLHIKMTDSWGEDNNIDMGPFRIVGFDGTVKGDAVTTYAPVPTEETKVLLEKRLLKHTVVRGEVTPLHPDVSERLHTDPSITFISTLSIPAVVAAVEAGDATEQQTAVATAYAAFKKASAVHHAAMSAKKADDAEAENAIISELDDEEIGAVHPAVDFFSLDPSTAASITHILLPFLGEAPAQEVQYANGKVSKGEFGMYDLPAGLPVQIEGDDDSAAVAEDVAPAIGTFKLNSGLPFVIAAVDNSGASVKYLYHEQDLQAALAKAGAVDGEDAEEIKQYLAAAKTTLDTEEDRIAFFTRIFAVIAGDRARADAVDGFHGLQDDEEKQLVKQLKAMGISAEEGRQALEGAAVELNASIAALATPRFLSGPANADNKHTVFRDLYTVTHDNFDDVIINSTEPVLFSVIDATMKPTVAVAARMCVLASLCAKYKVAVRICLLDCATNDVPLKHHTSDVFDSIRLYVKKSADAVAKKPAKAVKGAKGKAKKAAPEVPALCVNTHGQSVFMHTLSFDNESSDEERELMDDIDDDSLAPVPTLYSILGFVATHEPSAFPFTSTSAESKAMNKEAQQLTDALEDLSYCQAAAAVLVPSLGTRMKVQYPDSEPRPTRYIAFANGSAALAGVKAIKNLSIDIHNIAGDIPYPVGNLRVPFAGELPEELKQRQKMSIHGGDKPYAMLEEVASYITQMKGHFETSVAAVNPATQTFLRTRLVTQKLIKLLRNFPEEWVTAITANKAAFTGFSQGFSLAAEATGVFPTLPAVPEAVNAALIAAEQPAITMAVDEDKQIVFSPSDMEILCGLLTKCKDAMTAIIGAKVKTQETAAFGDVVIRVKNDKQLDRVLQGYVNIDAPKAMPLGGRVKKPVKSTDKKVPDAEDRLICVYVTELGDGSLANMQAIADTMKQISAHYKAEVESGNPDSKNVVWVKIDVEEFEEVTEMLDISATPAFVFLQNGGEAVDLRITGADAYEIPTLLKESIESMQMLDKNEDYDDEDCDDDC